MEDIWKGLLPALLVMVLTCGPRNHAPDVPAIPIGPSYGLPDSMYAFSTSTSDPDGDSVAIEFSWGGTAVVERTEFVEVGEPVIRHHVWRKPGVYAVKARAVDIRGRTSSWGPDIDVDVVHFDSLPLTPLRPEGPDSVRVGFIEEFSFPTRGPPGESLLFAFDWGDGRVSSEWEWEGPVRAGETLKTWQAFWREGDWYVRAMTRDGAKRTQSDWSAGKRTKVRFQPGSGWTEYYDAYNVNAIAPTNDGGYILALEQGWGPSLAKTDAHGRVQWVWSSDSVEASGLSVQQTSDSGYVMVGSQTGYFPWYSFDLVRVDKRGVPLWFRSYDDEDLYGFCVRQTPDGGFIVAGSRILLKTDSNGDSVWARDFDALGVELASDGGYVICGGWLPPTLTKFDVSGNVVWETRCGGTCARSVHALANGDYIVAGDAGENAYLARISSAGALIWERSYPGDGVALDVCQVADGGFCLVGLADWSAPCVIRTDATGALRWQREVSPDVNYDDCAGILATADNGCVVASCFCDDEGGSAALFKVDENGGIGPAGFEAGLPAGGRVSGGPRSAQRAGAERLRSAMRGEMGAR